MCEILSISVPNGTRKWFTEKGMSPSKLLQQRIETIKGNLPGSTLQFEEDNKRLKEKMIKIYEFLEKKNLFEECVKNV